MKKIMEHHFTTGNPKLDVFLSICGTTASVMGASYASTQDIPIGAKWVAWAVAVIAGALTIVNLCHLIYLRHKNERK